jgi:flagellar hook protein FlgE
MMRSLYAGVSGLQNHQVRMDVLGNNISNVNTVGFKKGRVNFQDLISQSMAGAARPTDELGGVNPKQVGLGMNIAAIDTIHTQGSLQTTGVMTDLAIQGDGFFILRTGNKKLVYPCRSLRFGRERSLGEPCQWNAGTGMAGSGGGRANLHQYFRCHWGLEEFPWGVKIPQRRHRQCSLPVTWTNGLQKYRPVQDQRRFERERGQRVLISTTPSEMCIPYGWTLPNGQENPTGGMLRLRWIPKRGIPTPWWKWGAPGNNNANTFIVEFSNLGTLLAVEDAAGDRLTEGALQVQVGFDVVGATPPAGGGPVRQTFNLNLGTVGGVANTVTQFAEKSSTKAFKQDGYGMGYLEAFKIDQSGVITGVFSNGNNRELGTDCPGKFCEPQWSGESGRKYLCGDQQLRRAKRFAFGNCGKGQDHSGRTGNEQRGSG